MLGRILGVLAVLFLIAAPPAQARNVSDTYNSPLTQGFITDVSSLGVFEINAGEIALARSLNEEVKGLTAKIIADHKQIDTNLKAALSEDQQQYLSVRLNAGLDKAMRELETAKPEGFDKTYIKIQASVYENALRAVSRYASRGDDKKLKAFAAQTLETLQAHKDMISALTPAKK